jgi:hypothetical protein
MIGTSCNEKNCPGWVPAVVAGLAMIVFVLFTAINDAHAGEVRVEITRELPEEKQLVVQHFYDEDSFAMWMVSKLEDDGCDPYVSEIKIIRNYEPKEI